MPFFFLIMLNDESVDVDAFISQMKSRQHERGTSERMMNQLHKTCTRFPTNTGLKRTKDKKETKQH